MAIVQARKSVEKRASTEKVRDEEKDADTVSVVDSADGDEALQLVGKERTAHFSEEYYKRLRRKLVCTSVLLRSVDRGLIAVP